MGYPCHALEGCSRCKPKVHSICCDLCNPTAFEKFEVLVCPKPAKQTAKSHIKAYTMTSTHHKLQDALFDWRDLTAPMKFKPSIVETFGPGILISDDIIACIVDCAQVGKVHSVAQLIKETSWQDDWAKEFGPSLLRVIHQFYPLAPPPQAASSADP